MQKGLTKRFRLRAALGLAALYAFCVLAPHAALALGNNAAHCLTDDHTAAHVHKAPAATTAHTHADGSLHHHPARAAHDDAGNLPHKNSDADGKSHSGNCCGLFCFSAITLDPGVTLPAPPAFATEAPGPDDALAGRGPDRLKRPPRT